MRIKPYVVIRAAEDAYLDDMNIKIHYAALPDALLLSLNEDVLKRTISQNLDNAKTESKATPKQ